MLTHRILKIYLYTVQETLNYKKTIKNNAYCKIFNDLIENILNSMRFYSPKNEYMKNFKHRKC